MGGEQKREIERLEERIQELEADRERLNWLIGKMDLQILVRLGGSDSHESVRAAIDRAMVLESIGVSIQDLTN